MRIQKSRFSILSLIFVTLVTTLSFSAHASGLKGLLPDPIKKLLSDPYKDLTIANTYRVTAQAVLDASMSLMDSLRSVSSAYDITVTEEKEYLKDLARLKNHELSFGEKFDGANKIAGYVNKTVQAMKEELDAKMDSDFEFSDDAREKLVEAYKHLVEGGAYQGFASKGGLSLLKKLKSVDAASEIEMALKDPKLGITKDDIKKFPASIKDFVLTFKKGYGVMRGIRKTYVIKNLPKKVKKEAKKNAEKLFMDGLPQDAENNTSEKKSGGFKLPFGKK